MYQRLRPSVKPLVALTPAQPDEAGDEEDRPQRAECREPNDRD
jgi:hypothetical protein